MRRMLAVTLIVVLALAVVAPPAEACLECVALGLASFAVFTQLISALTVPRVVYAAPGYYGPAYYGPYGGAYPAVSPPPAYYGPYGGAYPAVSPPPAYYGPYGGAYPAASPPAAYYPAASYAGPYAPTYVARPAPVGWTGPRVVQYAHGRHELRGDGVSVPYAWVWIPNARAPVVPSQTGSDDVVASRTP
jgi:hypothetical protein